jgi:uncharacterized protein (TIGR02145 family)
MKKTYRILILTLVIGSFLMLTSNCSKDVNNKPTTSETAKDIDGNVYHTVTIGTQVWMVENLKTTNFRNGDPIPNVTDSAAWRNLRSAAYCNYNNDVTIGNKYGKLYNWFAINDSREITPSGWHIPTNDEWNTLISYVNANLNTSGGIAKALAAKTDWISSTDAGAIGNDLTKNNSSGFTAVPGGYCHSSGAFYSIGEDGDWWSSTEPNVYGVWVRSLHFNVSFLITGTTPNKENGFSVRCIKD